MEVELQEDGVALAAAQAPKPRTFEAWLGQAGDKAPLPRTDHHLPVLVVGGGPAGLAAMAALHQAGVDFEGLEFHSQVGGILGPVESDQ